MALKLSPPWIIFYRDVEAMFKYDPEVKVIYDDDKKELSLYVESSAKADALIKILPREKAFGNVKVGISIYAADDTPVEASDKSIYATAFEGNAALATVEEVKGLFATTITYVVFRKQVIQYYSDNLADYYGNRSCLYQDIANEIFEPNDHVFFCTDIADPLFELETDGVTWP